MAPEVCSNRNLIVAARYGASGIGTLVFDTSCT